MTGEETLKLLEAGFTADEIREMMKPAAAADPEPKKETPAADPEPKKETAAADPEPKKETPAADPESEAFKNLNAAISALAKQIQGLNIKESRQKEQPAESAEQILASIINPPTK